MHRRDILKTLCVSPLLNGFTLATDLFANTTKPSNGSPYPTYLPRYRVFHKAMELMDEYGDRVCQWSVMQEFGHRLHPAMLQEILDITRIPYKDIKRTHRGLGVATPNTHTQDIGMSCDWKLQYVTRPNFRHRVCMTLQKMVDGVICKINEVKKHNAHIVNFELWGDSRMLRQQRMGFYCWAEIELPISD